MYEILKQVQHDEQQTNDKKREIVCLPHTGSANL